MYLDRTVSEIFSVKEWRDLRDRRTAARQHRPRYRTSFSFEKVTSRPHEHVSIRKTWKQHINMRITWPQLSVSHDHSSNVRDVIYWFL